MKTICNLIYVSAKAESSQQKVFQFLVSGQFAQLKITESPRRFVYVSYIYQHWKLKLRKLSFLRLLTHFKRTIINPWHVNLYNTFDEK